MLAMNQNYQFSKPPPSPPWGQLVTKYIPINFSLNIRPVSIVSSSIINCSGAQRNPEHRQQHMLLCHLTPTTSGPCEEIDKLYTYNYLG